MLSSEQVQSGLPGYKSQLEESALLGKSLFEHVFRGGDCAAMHAALLTQRRIHCTDDTLPPVTLLIDMPEVIDRKVEQNLHNTLTLWALQSHPGSLVHVLCRPSQIGQLGDIVKTFRRAGSEWLQIGPADSCVPPGDAYIIIAQPGELHHPGLAHRVACTAKQAGADIITWNTQVINDEGNNVLLFLRKPQLQPTTLASYDYIQRSAAYRNSMSGFSWAGIFESSQRVRYLLEKAKCESTSFHALAEFLQLVPQSLHQYPGPPVACRQPSVETEFSISVIIPFRDKPELTLRCLQSLLNQELNGHLEVLLINNQSTADSIDTLNKGLRTLFSSNDDNLVCRILDYDKPFNHSAQCNLGAQSASGEVLVFLNNDACFIGTTALQEMAAQAVQLNVGTVGCRIESTSGDLVCAGIRARVVVGTEYNSLVEESREQLLSHHRREVFANTFAVAALSKKNYQKVGPLNSIEFPNGYNDVEYNLRVRRAGLRNIYLGHLTVLHEPGTSRGKCDELAEKILLRQRFPEVLCDAMFQLEEDDHFRARANKVLGSKALQGRRVQVA